MKRIISIIGGGAMGSAVAEGLLASGVEASVLRVANPHTAKLAHLVDAGVTVTTDNLEAVRDAQTGIIAVKPWILPGVAEQLRDVLADKDVCLIVAGITGSDLKDMFADTASLSIVMPNTAVALGESMTFIVPLRGDCESAMSLFGRTGRAMMIDERLLPGATALASCGIAYGMRYVRAACEGGVELGFRASEAQEIVVQTLKGVAALLADTSRHPEAEIDRVTTPGGLTIRGLNAMERAGFSTAVVEGLKASVK